MTSTTPDFSQIQALLFDYDRTITNSERIVTPRTQTAIKALQPYITLGLCTGRSFEVLSEQDKAMFSPNSLHVLHGGAQVISNQGEVKWEQALEAEVVEKLLAIANKHNASFLVKSSRAQYGNDVALKRYLNNARYSPPSPIAEMNDSRALSILLIELTQDALNEFRTFPNVTYKEMVSYEKEVYAEITAPNINKSRGIDEWSKITNIPIKNIMGFGDSQNDLEFIQIVGWGVAMGNAISELQSLANQVIGSNDDDGLAAFLEELLPQLKARTQKGTHE